MPILGHDSTLIDMHANVNDAVSSMRSDLQGPGACDKLDGRGPYALLVFLGMLDSMMLWRGGFELNETYALLILSGIILYGPSGIRVEVCGSLIL